MTKRCDDSLLKISVFFVSLWFKFSFRCRKLSQKTPRHDGVRGENRNVVGNDIGEMERKTGLEPATLTLAR